MKEENIISKTIVNAALKIHKGLGPGLFESVYEEVLFEELKAAGLLVERQEPINLIWNEKTHPNAFKADIVVDKKVIIELKAINRLTPVHTKQLYTYLKLSNMKLGLLINFNSFLIKDGIKRVVNLS